MANVSATMINLSLGPPSLNAAIDPLFDSSEQQLVFGSTIPQPIFTTDASVKALERHLKELTEEEIEQFRHHSKIDVLAYAQSVEATAVKHGDASRSRKVNDLLRPFFRTVGLYVPAFSAASQFDPYPSSLVIGGVMCVLQISDNFNEYQGLLLEWLAKLTSKMECLLKFDFYIYRHDDDVQDILVTIYGDVLLFCQKALRLHEDTRGQKKHLRILGNSLVKRFTDTFGPIISDFERHVGLYEQRVAFCDKQRFLGLCRLQVDEYLQQSGYRQKAISYFERAELHHEEGLQLAQEQRIFHDSSYTFQRNVSTILTANVDVSRADQERRDAKDKRDREEAAQRERAKHWETVIKWIPCTEFRDEQNFRNDKVLEGTGVWLETKKEFIDWRSSPGSSTLWVRGKPSSGKSILAAIIWERLSAQKGTGVAMAKFYCKRTNPIMRTSCLMLSSIFKELCVQLTSMNDELEVLYDEKHLIQSGPTSKEILNIVPGVLQRFKETLILIDGLDECEDPKIILGYIKQWIDKPNLRLKVIVFSRPEHIHIQSALSDGLQLRVDDGANLEDILAIISSKLAEEDFVAFRDKPRMLDVVKSAFIEKAEGSFLFVDLQANTLKGPLTKSQIDKRLQALPRGIDEMYDAPLKRIISNGDEDIRDLALSTLLWISTAIRPLSHKELIEALAVKPGMTSYSQLDLIPSGSHITAMCADLVDLDEAGHYQLVHSSLRDYMQTLVDKCPEALKLIQEGQRKSDETIAEVCLTYLLFEDFEVDSVEVEDDLESMSGSYSLLRYAAANWGEHVRHAPHFALSDLTWAVVDRSELRNLSMKCAMMEIDEKNVTMRFEGNDSPSSLHILAFFGLTKLANQRPELRKFDFSVDNLGRTPLEYAVIEGHRDMCLWLLERDQDLDPKPFANSGDRFALHKAIVQGWKDVVERLIFHKFDANFQGVKSRRTPLIEAVYQGKQAIVERLLETDVDLNAVDDQERTALIHAAEGDYTGIVLALLEKQGIDVDVQDEYGWTALHCASSNGNVACVKKLLAKSANVHLSTAAIADCWTALHFAAQRNRPNIIKLLCDSGARADATDSDGMLPLNIAAFNDALAAARLLHDMGPPINNLPPTSTSLTMINIAAYAGGIDFIEFILEKDPEALRSQDSERGNTALHIAATNGNAAVCEYLLSVGAAVDARDLQQVTPLLDAVLSGDLATIQLLLNKGADPKVETRLGASVLHCVAQHGHAFMVRPLLEAGASSKSRTKAGHTAFHVAAVAGHHAVVRELCSFLGYAIKVTDNDIEKTLLHTATAGGHVELVKLLLKLGVTQDMDSEGNLPIHLAPWTGRLEIVKLLTSAEVLDVKGMYGRTPLQTAAAAGNLSIVSFFLDRGAATDVTDDFANTPLHDAIYMRHVEIANLLLDKNASVLGRNEDGETVMHAAASIGDTGLMERLTGLGCDLQSTFKHGKSVFHCAAESGNVRAIKFLMEQKVNGTFDKTEVGDTAVFYAATGGHKVMLEKLHSLGAKVDVRNDLGRSPLILAALRGHAAIVRKLVVLGARVDQEERFPTITPLTAASSIGSLHTVAALLQADANVDRILEHSKETALTVAASTHRSEIVKKLLIAGADPHHRDRLGKNALDYAYGDYKTWKALGRCTESYRALSRDQHRQILHHTIRYCVDQITSSTNSTLTARHKMMRWTQLDVLGHSLLFLEEEEALKDAKLSLSEPHFVDQMYSCDICNESFEDSDAFFCRTCLDVELCSGCHEKYTTELDPVVRAPGFLRILEEFEDELAEVKIYLSRPLAQSWMDLSIVVNMFPDVADWLKWKYEEYKKWDDEYGSEFSSKKRPGWELLKLLHNGIIGIDMGELKNDEKKLEAGRKSAANYLRVHGGDVRAKPFTCCNHKYIKVSKEEYMTLREDRDLFREDGRLSDRWFRNILAKYPSPGSESPLKDGSDEGATLPTGSYRQTGMETELHSVRSSAESVERPKKIESTVDAFTEAMDEGNTQAAQNSPDIMRDTQTSNISEEFKSPTIPNPLPDTLREIETGRISADGPIAHEPTHWDREEHTKTATTCQMIKPTETYGFLVVWALKLAEMAEPGFQRAFLDGRDEAELLDNFSLRTSSILATDLESINGNIIDDCIILEP